ncbi:MAG TPA: vWA domain-containing protein, partial [Polyangiaceae bacterium]|nr:vWA domain-containing protein [Polyangiaceae bacterium]
RHDQAMFYIDVPNGAVATGLRTLGTRAGRPYWFSGELLEAEAAAEKYRELTGIGGYYPKDPALLSWRSQGLLALQVFPCPPGGDKVVEYTLVIPTEYRDGAHHLELPPLGTEQLVASIKAHAADPKDRLLVGGTPPPAIIKPEWGTSLDFALVPHDTPRLGGNLVATEFAPNRILTRYAVEAAPHLSEVPRGAHIVLVLDTSLSTDSGFIDRAKLAFDAYLSHFTDASVELVTFNRKLERPFGGFVTVADARTRLEALAVRRGNGSDVDRALAEADRLLAGSGAGARRVVMLTDGLTRQGLTPERLRAATSTSGAALHVGLLDDGPPSLTRNDDHPWASGLRPNHGLVWRASVSESASPAETRTAFEEWARPKRLDHLHVYSSELGLQTVLEESPAVLDEGQGFENLLITERAAPWLAIEGELWTERVTNTFTLDKKSEKRWSALVFGSSLLSELSEPEMMTLAVRGGAVSPVTSYLAIEPGVRPSTEGLDWGLGLSGFGSGGGGMGSGATSVSGMAPALDREAFLKGHIADDWRRCGGRPDTATITLETTSAEIANIQSVDITVSDALLTTCLREAVWDLVLPAAFSEEWNSFTIRV